MNPYHNPLFLSKIIKSYLFDIDRLKKSTETKLINYQNNRFRKQLYFADTVPVYQQIYNSINVREINTLSDIGKLPYISKYEMKKNYPDGIISKKIKKKHLVEVATSGTTGKSLSIFVDQFDIIMGLFGYLRTLREYNLSWRKNRIVIIGDFAPHTAESGYINRGLEPQINFNFLFKNILWLNTNDPPQEIMKALEQFKPEFIGGYVGMLGHLALLKEQGYGKQVTPKIIASTGAVLDPQLRKYIELQFNSRVFEVYGATETGPIAYECASGGYHVMADLLHIEVQNKNSPIEYEKPGRLVVTKLYGKGTPIIRYTAINDIVSLSKKSCSCGIPGPLIKRIYGRDDLSILLPDGRILLPATISGIYAKILYELKTTKLKDTRLIQHDLNSLEIQIVIDPYLRDKGSSVAEIMNHLKQSFAEKVGPNVTITINEVDKLGHHQRRIISNVKIKDIPITDYVQ
jgi:phenylacetate-CoA ligase